MQAETARAVTRAVDDERTNRMTLKDLPQDTVFDLFEISGKFVGEITVAELNDYYEEDSYVFNDGGIIAFDHSNNYMFNGTLVDLKKNIADANAEAERMQEGLPDLPF